MFLLPLRLLLAGGQRLAFRLASRF